MGWLAWGLIFALVAAILAPSSAALIEKQNQMARSRLFERLGRDLSKKIEKNAVMFDRVPHLAYFSGGINVNPPYAKIDDVLHFARNRGVSYWVVSSIYVPRLRPQYTPLLDPNADHNGLKPIAVYGEKGKLLIVVYRILSG